METPKDKESKDVNKAVEAFNRILDAARKDIYAKVLDHAQRHPNSPFNGSPLVQLEKTVASFYSSLGVKIKQEFKSSLPDAMQAFYSRAVSDLRASGVVLSAVGKPDPSRISYFMQDAWDRVAGRTDKMRVDHIRQLRQIAAQVYQKASVTGMTTKEASKEAMAEALKIPGFEFVDRAGRTWGHKTYFDMLARTELMNAGRATYDAKVAKEGYDVMLLTVSGEPCPACAAYEGRLFSLTGATKGLPSKADLEKAGVFHPNCTHSYSAAPDYVVQEDYDGKGRPKEGYNSAKTPQKDDKEAWRQYRKDQDTPQKSSVAKEETLPLEDAKTLQAFNYEPANSVEEIQANAQKADLAKNIDFSGVNGKGTEMLNNGMSTLADELNLHPEIRDGLNFVGTIQNSRQIEKNYLIERKVALLLKSGYNEEEAKALALKTTKARPVQNGTWLIFTHPNKTGTGGITINRDCLNKADAFALQLKRNVQYGGHPIGCDTIQAQVRHEVGHALDKHYGLSDNSEVRKLWSSLGLQGVKKEVSSYATENIGEFIAEAYAEYRSNPKPRATAMKIGKIIEELKAATKRK